MFPGPGDNTVPGIDDLVGNLLEKLRKLIAWQDQSCPRGDAGGLNREYVLRIRSVS